jgi:hypothetical protein
MTVLSLARTWGSTTPERAMRFPCDRHVDGPADAYYRAVDVAAPAAVVFRWLCQLRAAPYSYDLIDNLGRRSPRALTSGLERLSPGQRFMTIFELVEFEWGSHVTIVMRRGNTVFGDVAVTYMVLARGEDRSRLLVKVLVTARGGPLVASLRGALLPSLDLVMMRKQLLTLGRLAEASATPTVDAD